MEELLITARQLLNTAHEVQADCKTLVSVTAGIETPVLKGYHATGLVLTSKYTLNPMKKFDSFKVGKAILEDLISENFDEVELRFLRYAIQSSAPKFLGYYKNLEQDRAILKNFILANRNTALTQHMMVFISNTKNVILKEI